MLLPSKGRAENGQGLASAGGGLKEGMAVALPPGPIERRNDPSHEHQLRPVRLVGELHRHASDLVQLVAFRRTRVRV